MTDLTSDQKAVIRAQAKGMGINTVGKTIEKIQALIIEKNEMIQVPGDEDQATQFNIPSNPLHKLAKELGVKFTKSTPREEIVFAVADLKGWANESAETIEYLINGGCIESVPGFTGIAPKNVRPAPVEPAEPKKPRKIVKKPAQKTAEKKTAVRDGMTTIQDLCEELNVEPRIARRKLRASDILKPSDSGWMWKAGHADIKKVRELLKA